MKRPAGRLWLCICPVAVCLLDVVVTFLCQPAEYARGNYACAVEGCPPFKWLLMQHPLAFFAGAAVGVAVYLAMLLLTPRRFAMAASIVVILGHSWGTATWLLREVTHGYWLAVALFITAGVMITVTWEKNMRLEVQGPLAAEEKATTCPQTQKTTPGSSPSG